MTTTPEIIIRLYPSQDYCILGYSQGIGITMTLTDEWHWYFSMASCNSFLIGNNYYKLFINQSVDQSHVEYYIINHVYHVLPRLSLGLWASSSKFIGLHVQGDEQEISILPTDQCYSKHFNGRHQFKLPSYHEKSAIFKLKGQS